MAQKFYNDIDLQQLELLNGTIENQTTDANAGTGVDGQLYFNTTDKVLKVYDEDLAAWKQVGGFDGALIYQGGYNAATNTPDLDSVASIAVEKGWTYTVTADGLFFTEQVRVGDVLISEVDQAAGASALANWTTVQNNIDLASLTQVGIGNVIPSLAIDELGIAVAYTAGTASVGLDIDGLAAAGSVAATALVASELALPVYNSATPEVSNQKLTVAQIVTLATASTSYDEDVTPTAATSYTITHNLGTKKVIVQLYDKTTFDTFFADVVRTSDNVVTINFDLIPTNNFFVLVQK